MLFSPYYSIYLLPLDIHLLVNDRSMIRHFNTFSLPSSQHRFPELPSTVVIPPTFPTLQPTTSLDLSLLNCSHCSLASNTISVIHIYQHKPHHGDSQQEGH